MNEDHSIHVSEGDASSGVTGHGVRYVLLVSLVLAIIAMVVVGW